MTIRVVIADDQVLVRAGFSVLVNAATDMEVVAEAGTGPDAVAAGRRHLPDVILMDIRMPTMDGIEATRQLLDDPATKSIRSLILTTFDLDSYVFGALKAGASGFLLKDTPPELLLAGIRTVAAGDALLAPSVTRRLIRDFVNRPAAVPRALPSLLDPLTEREREILVHVASGRSNGDIAGRLHISVATVKTHVSRLLTKLDAHDRAQLVVIAYETGLIQPSSQARPVFDSPAGDGACDRLDL
ncbi:MULTISPECIES: response regulator transcription factor [Actinomadura]|uniref:Response regulator n=1 Tax=Actinomadura litoris TaxID=2678616 RepID=A0A7K1L2R0_9ACTN|nr:MULTISPECIES: response regulator transcription factor [Actinomadura]MBT2208909.1 response regulator transcription factor [Actinomadura sp. NEAU-AAG7]MUN38526.1 response regulator [Actinomadura litoris]